MIAEVEVLADVDVSVAMIERADAEPADVDHFGGNGGKAAAEIVGADGTPIIANGQIAIRVDGMIG